MPSARSTSGTDAEAVQSQSKCTSRVVCCTAPCPTLTIGTCDQEHDRLLFFASERVRDLRIVLIARGRAVLPPGGGLSIPCPHARMNPTNIDATPLAQSERERSSATYGGFT